MTMQLNPSVGVAPGTTTLQLSGDNCPPDEQWHYTLPPVVTEGYPSGMTPADGTSSGTNQNLDPYADASKLSGLGQATPNWGFILFAGLAAFLGVLGYGYWRKRRKK